MSCCSCLVLLFGSICCYFFFFKQKTAYEMRISDWSSDVCSSDHPKAKPLRCSGARTIRLTQQAWRAGIPIATGTDFVDPASNPWPEVHAELRYLADDVGMPPLAVIHSATLVGARAAGQDKIGRAHV